MIMGSGTPMLTSKHKMISKILCQFWMSSTSGAGSHTGHQPGQDVPEYCRPVTS